MWWHYREDRHAAAIALGELGVLALQITQAAAGALAEQNLPLFQTLLPFSTTMFPLMTCSAPGFPRLRL